MTSRFRMETLSGIFWIKDGKTLLLSPEDGGDAIDVFAVLNSFVGFKVKVALHHWPTDPPQTGKWGGGCCFWQPSGKCPAGHHENPTYLLNVGGEGFLNRSGDSWWVDVDGTLEPLPFDKMEGHQGRLVILTLIDLEEFKKGFTLPDIPLDGDGPQATPEQIDAVAAAARDLRDLVGQFKEFLNYVKED